MSQTNTATVQRLDGTVSHLSVGPRTYEVIAQQLSPLTPQEMEHLHEVEDMLRETDAGAIEAMRTRFRTLSRLLVDEELRLAHRYLARALDDLLEGSDTELPVYLLAAHMVAGDTQIIQRKEPT